MVAQPYETLGVTKTATDAEIKAAYRKLARELHPDVNPGDAEAEARFKEVSEAYAVLSDPEKRRRYDAYGEAGVREGFDENAWNAGFGGGGAAGFEDLFRNFSGFSQGYTSAGFGGRPTRGRDIERTLRVSFEQAAQGFQSKFRYQRPERCDVCGGTGVVAGRPCSACGRTGERNVEKTLTVNVPQGAADGDRIRLRGKGAQAASSQAKSGDLILNIVVQPHAVFTRDGLDLFARVPVSPLDAMLGGSLDVDTLDGAVRVKLPPALSAGQKLRLAGRGVTRSGKTGALVVEPYVDPAMLVLDDAAKAALVAFRERLASPSTAATDGSDGSDGSDGKQDVSGAESA